MEHEELNKNLERLNKNLEKDLSFWRSILMSIVKGAAGAIGATIVAALILTLLAQTLGGIPAIKNFLNSVESSQSGQK